MIRDGEDWIAIKPARNDPDRVEAVIVHFEKVRYGDMAVSFVCSAAEPDATYGSALEAAAALTAYLATEAAKPICPASREKVEECGCPVCTPEDHPAESGETPA